LLARRLWGGGKRSGALCFSRLRMRCGGGGGGVVASGCLPVRACGGECVLCFFNCTPCECVRRDDDRGAGDFVCMRGSFHDRSRLSAAIRRSVSALPVFLQSSTESMALRSAVAFACEPVSAGSALLCYAVCWRGSKGARPRCFRVCTRSALSFAGVGCALAVDCAVSRTTVQLQSRKARRQVLECFGGLRGTASWWGRRTHRC
jgi:hypothetical protein